MEEEDEEEKEDNPLLVKEKKEKIDKTNLWFNKVATIVCLRILLWVVPLFSLDLE